MSISEGVSKKRGIWTKTYPDGSKLYFSTATEYNSGQGGRGLDPSSVRTYVLYQRPRGLVTEWVTGGVLGVDGKIAPLKNSEAFRLNDGKLENLGSGGLYDYPENDYVLGPLARKDLVAGGNTSLRYQTINNSKFLLQKDTGVSSNEVNRAYDVSSNITQPGQSPTPSLIGPPLTASAATPPASPADPSPTPQKLVPLTPEELNNQFEKTKDINYGVLRYPKLQHKEETFDYLKIDVLKYVKSGLIASGSNTIDLARPSERLKGILGTVILPMQPNISDSNGVSWNEDQLNALQAAFASVAYSSVDSAGNIQSGSDLLSWLRSSASNLGSTLGTLANDPGLSNLIAGYFAGQAVGTNVIGRATGAVINNNLELLFAGPKLRTFRYSYKFTPRSKDEAKEVKQIIRLFKREMSTSRSDTGLFLQTPNVFQLKYIYNNGKQGSGNQHPFLNKIKPCALTNFNVNYTPDGTYMTYADGGSMTSYAVDMEFSELEPIYKEDYDDGDDVNYPKSMGY